MKWDDQEPPVKSEINIAPLVDVMLVLLIIFMLASPFLYEKIKVQLPQGSGQKTSQLNKGLVILTVNSKREFFLENKKVLEANLFQEIKKRLEVSREKTLYLKADYALKYGDVANLMAVLQNGKGYKIALITKNEQVD